MALKVLRDTINASVEGIGGRVQMGVVRESGPEVIEEADMRGLHDTADLWGPSALNFCLGVPRLLRPARRQTAVSAHQSDEALLIVPESRYRELANTNRPPTVETP